MFGEMKRRKPTDIWNREKWTNKKKQNNQEIIINGITDTIVKMTEQNENLEVLDAINEIYQVIEKMNNTSEPVNNDDEPVQLELDV